MKTDIEVITHAYCKRVIDAKVKKGIDVPTSDDVALTQSEEISITLNGLHRLMHYVQ